MDREDPFVKVIHSSDSSIPSVGSDDEESFVVLGPSSPSLVESIPYNSHKEEVLPPLRTNKIHEMQNIIKMKISELRSEPFPEAPTAQDKVACSVANIVISPDSSYEEIQKQVEELIKENDQLKNVIEQNNASMKNQYDRFVAYKDEVIKVMKSHKEKFTEAKAYVDKCKEENVKLFNELEVHVNLKGVHEEEILSLKDKLRHYENSSQFEATVEQNMAQFDLKMLNEKNRELKNELAESKLKNSELMRENEKLTTRLVTMPQFEDHLQGKQQEIDKLKEEKLIFQNREEENSLEIKNLRTQLEKLQHQLGHISKEKEQLAQFQGDVAAYEERLRLKQTEIVGLEEELQTTTLKLQDLQEQHNPHLVEDHQKVLAQLSTAQRTITALEQDREEKAKELDELKRRNQECNSKSDEAFALKEQLEVYRQDFEAEKESKKSLKQEKDQVVEDLKNIQKRNKELQHEIEQLRARNEVRVDGFPCPKCAFKFNNYDSLENHVHRCLDLDGFP
jgi:DNA repair exonuclease SbcCD ATPase subunit